MRYLLLMLVCVFAGCRAYYPPSGYEKYVARPAVTNSVQSSTTNAIPLRDRLHLLAVMTNTVAKVETVKSTDGLDQSELLQQISLRLFELVILQGLVFLGVCVIIARLNNHKGKAG